MTAHPPAVRVAQARPSPTAPHQNPRQTPSLPAVAPQFALENVLGCGLWQAGLLALDGGYRASAKGALGRLVERLVGQGGK